MDKGDAVFAKVPDSNRGNFDALRLQDTRLLLGLQCLCRVRNWVVLTIAGLHCLVCARYTISDQHKDLLDISTSICGEFSARCLQRIASVGV